MACSSHLPTLAPRRSPFAAVAVTLLVALTAGAISTLDAAHRDLVRGILAPGRLGAHDRYLDGVERRAVTAGAGERLALTYDLEPAAGTLEVEVLAPDGTVVFDRRSSAAATGRAELHLASAGRYLVEVRGAAARGSFDVRFRTEVAVGG